MAPPHARDLAVASALLSNVSSSAVKWPVAAVVFCAACHFLARATRRSRSGFLPAGLYPAAQLLRSPLRKGFRPKRIVALLLCVFVAVEVVLSSTLVVIRVQPGKEPLRDVAGRPLSEFSSSLRCFLFQIEPHAGGGTGRWLGVVVESLRGGDLDLPQLASATRTFNFSRFQRSGPDPGGTDDSGDVPATRCRVQRRAGATFDGTISVNTRGGLAGTTLWYSVLKTHVQGFDPSDGPVRDADQVLLRRAFEDMPGTDWSGSVVYERISVFAPRRVDFLMRYNLESLPAFTRGVGFPRALHGRSVNVTVTGTVKEVRCVDDGDGRRRHEGLGLLVEVFTWVLDGGASGGSGRRNLTRQVVMGGASLPRVATMSGDREWDCGDWVGSTG